MLAHGMGATFTVTSTLSRLANLSGTMRSRSHAVAFQSALPWSLMLWIEPVTKACRATS